MVFGVLEVCEAEGVPHPTLVSESGRATVAHHAALVVDILGVGEFVVGKIPERAPEGAETSLVNLFGCFQDLTRKNLLEVFHDAVGYRDECLSLFNLGHLSLEHRGLAEDVFWATCQKVLRLARTLDEMPEELQTLDLALADTYFCNFSVFQSLPDSWAIDQLFPVVPIHRLDARARPRPPSSPTSPATPTARSTTSSTAATSSRCSSCTRSTASPTTSACSWSAPIRRAWATCTTCSATPTPSTSRSTPRRGTRSRASIAGDTVTEVLQYVRYNRSDLVARVRQAAEAALRAKRMTLEESRKLLQVYERGCRATPTSSRSERRRPLAAEAGNHPVVTRKPSRARPEPPGSDDGRVAIYTDGGASPNPGPGGWGAVLLLAGEDGAREVRELSGGAARTTNNRMELTAAIRALEALPAGTRARLFTDSQYLRRGITEWLPAWIARGWRKKDGGAVENDDLWRRLAELAAAHDVAWSWVRGHAGHRWNERADALATAAARPFRPAARRGEAGAGAASAPRAEIYLKVSCRDGEGGGRRGCGTPAASASSAAAAPAPRPTGSTSKRRPRRCPPCRPAPRRRSTPGRNTSARAPPPGSPAGAGAAGEPKTAARSRTATSGSAWAPCSRCGRCPGRRPTTRRAPRSPASSRGRRLEDPE